MKDEEKMRELSRLFAEACGLPIPHKKTEAGILHDASGREVWHWFKCPRHRTWMQPCECGGYPHWHCRAKGGKCSYIRAAKMRTIEERELFRLMRYIEAHG